MGESISVVVPVYNEQDVIKTHAGRFNDLASKVKELIFVDGGSQDNTVSLLKSLGFLVISSEAGRAAQMNTGAKHSSGSVIVFLHVDTVLPEHFDTLINLDSGEGWGYFRVGFDLKKIRYRWLARGINFRAACFKVATGDQAIFISSQLFHRLEGFQQIALMEDIELTRRLKKISDPNIVQANVITSARRWEQKGFIKTVLLMWWMQLAYKCGVSPDRLVQWYR